MLAGDYSSLNGTWQTTDGGTKIVLKMVPSFLVQNIRELYQITIKEWDYYC
ncbi:MAG: hypothetical protein MUW51_02485 [Lactococcus lactis]|nr:hypothetical protein [Lactococcus lactis]